MTRSASRPCTRRPHSQLKTAVTATTSTANGTIPESVKRATTAPIARPDASLGTKSPPGGAATPREAPAPPLAASSSHVRPGLSFLAAASNGRSSHHAPDPAFGPAELVDRLLQQLATEIRPDGLEKR